jgi:hypothetical protein
MIAAEVHQAHLYGCKDRIREEHAEEPEQSTHDQLHGKHDRRRDVDRPARDVRDDQIAIDVLNEEIDEDRP